MPDVKPEPYHGSVSHAANYRGSVPSPAGYLSPSTSATGPMGPSSSRIYEMMTPSGMLGGGYSMAAMPPGGGITSGSPFTSRYGSGYGSYGQASSIASFSPLGPQTPRGLIGGPSYMPDRNRGPLPYALVPALSTFPFG